MKVFRTVYYFAIALIAVVAVVLTSVSAYSGNVDSGIDLAAAVRHAKNFSAVDVSADNDDAVNYITGELDRLGINEASPRDITEKDPITQKDVVKVDTENIAAGANYVVMTTSLTSDERHAWEKERGVADEDLSGYSVDTALRNIVVRIPATSANAGVILLTAHYDSVKYAPGANDNAANVGAMLEVIRTVKDKTGLNNDIIFVFTDGGLNGGLGAYVLREKFIGFSKAVERIGFGASFDSYGTKGPVTLVNSSSNNANVIAALNKLSGGITANSALSGTVLFDPKVSDFNIFGDTPSLAFANILGGEEHGTALDNADNINENLVSASGALMLGIIDNFGGIDLEDLQADNGRAVYFNFLGFGVISYSAVAAYVIAGILILLLAAVIVLSVLKRSLDWKAIGAGVFVQALSAAVAVAVAFGLYYIIALMLAGFGIVSINAISIIAASNIGILIAGILIAGAAAMLVQSLLRKFMHVKAQNIVAGNVLIWALLAIVFSFALPQISHIFVWTAILELIVMLVITLAKDKFKDKVGFDIQRLFLYFIPVVVTIPIVGAAILLANALLGAAALPLVVIIPVSALGFLTPYIGYLDGTLGAFVKKLPERTVRVQRTAIQKVEDKAKRGKFVEKTVTRVDKEKRPNTYKTWQSSVCVLLCGVIVAFGSTLFYNNYSANISTAGADFGFYDDAVVYVYDGAGITETGFDKYWIVKDLNAYNHIADALVGFKYAAAAKGYVKQDTTTQNGRITQIYNAVTSSATVDGNDREVTIYPGADDIRFSVKLSATEGITKINVISQDNFGARNEEGYELTFDNAETILLENLKGETTLLITGRSSAYGGTAQYIGQSVREDVITQSPEWEDIVAAL
ncbi:MAG: Zn-dependent exopeptidase M28, partial [Clostridiales bacterium]|nr:Zn-dependent exopeptidase M28 [Clostridiales bacterium]